MKNFKIKFKRKLAKWIDVDLEKYDSLKNDNRKLRTLINDIDKEIKIQSNEINTICKHKTDKDVNQYFPEDITLSKAYDIAANTERLIYKQKLQYLKTIINK